MTLKKTLLELKKVMEKWGLEQDDWSLFMHYCDILQGYDIKYARDDHLHIMIRIDKVPWGAKKSDINHEVVTPTGSKYAMDFSNFIKKTGYDFHILVGEAEFFDQFIKKYSILYKLNSVDKIRMATTIGNVIWIDLHMEDMLKKYSLEVVARRMIWPELINKEAKRKGDKDVEKLTTKLIKKYRPKDKDIIKNKNVAQQYYKKHNALQGEVGYQGKVKGNVFYIENPDRPPKIKKGLIIVAKLTSPKLVPQIKASKAVVTDEGGQLSHAAIFCREFKIPCIVGTKIATQVLKDGDHVEVDANKGIVRKI